MQLKPTDFLVIGGGILGITVARSLKKTFPNSSIRVIEKETTFGAHTSGRNSGVLHAGFYYSAESLKARFTRVGAQKIREYCAQKNLHINPCGKLVVAQTPDDLPQMDELLKRAKLNQVQLESVTEKEAREIEPNVKTLGRALWSPTTASVNPVEVLNSVIQDAKSEGIEILNGIEFVAKKNSTIQTTAGNTEAGYVVNAAGLHADRIAIQFGFSKNYRIVPFKGLYLYGTPTLKQKLRCHIYPVPNLKNPFLGVHFTLTVDGNVKIGPTAIPAFWRENYGGFENFKFSELIEIGWRELNLLAFSGFDFKKLAWDEMKKHSKKRMQELASDLIYGLESSDIATWGKPGIRAQLLNINTKKLEMDYVMEGDSKSFHVLNAVSPAFTSSFPFADFVTEKIRSLVKG